MRQIFLLITIFIFLFSCSEKKQAKNEYIISPVPFDDSDIYTLTAPLWAKADKSGQVKRWEKVDDLSHELYNLGHLYFLDVRGTGNAHEHKTYNQSHIPVIEQTEAVDHLAWAAYMWSGMADVAALTGDKAYVNAA